MAIGDEPEQLEANPGSPSESEDLTNASLSVHDCDSEREGDWEDLDDESSDNEMGGTHKPGLMNLKFQLDAAKAGESHGFC